MVVIVLVLDRDPKPALLAVAAILVGVSLLEGVASWLGYRYSVVDGELRVRRGYLIRQRTVIPADRVQTVDVSAGLVQRVFGLVKVEVKTATGSHIVMSAITRADADLLLRALAPDPARKTDRSSTLRSRYSLSWKKLVLAASTSGRLGVLLSGIGWLYSRVDEIVEPRLVEALSRVAILKTLPPTSPVVVAILAAAALLVAFAASFVAEVVRFGGFSVERVADQLVIRRGLFERREVSLSLERIQAVRIVEGLLRQPLGYAAVEVDTAGHSEERDRSTELHPFLHRTEWLSMLSNLVPEYAVQPELIGPPRRALWRFVLAPMAVGVAIGSVLSITLPLGWLSLPFVGLVPWLGLLGYRDAAIGAQGTTLFLRRRRLRRVTAVVQRRRVQFAETSSSFFQQRKQLANCTVAVASGAAGRHLTVPDLDAETAGRIRNWCAARADAGTDQNSIQIESAERPASP